MQMQLTAADGHSFTAWATGPRDAPCGVVVLPEIFGVNAHIRRMAEHFADHGYRAICPSLFDRAPQAPQAIELDYDIGSMHRGLALRKAITDEAALLDIEAAARALESQSLRMVTGYCWGGYLTWRTACLSSLFQAASCWYGGGIVNHRHDKPRIPVQLHFGEQDAPRRHSARGHDEFRRWSRGRGPHLSATVRSPGRASRACSSTRHAGTVFQAARGLVHVESRTH